MRYRLPKTERLKSQKSIKELFDKGSSFFLYPFKVVYRTGDTDGRVLPKILVSVSKRKIPKAVDRNLMKRRIREAYRLNKGLLLEASRSLEFGLVYVSADEMDFHKLEGIVKKVLQRILEEVKKQKHETDN